MTTAIAPFNVAEYDHWRAGYARAVGHFNQLSRRIWRGQDNPNRVVIIETFDTRESAEHVFTSGLSRQAIRCMGAIDQPPLRLLGEPGVQVPDRAASH